MIYEGIFLKLLSCDQARMLGDLGILFVWANTPFYHFYEERVADIERRLTRACVVFEARYLSRADFESLFRPCEKSARNENSLKAFALIIFDITLIYSFDG